MRFPGPCAFLPTICKPEAGAPCQPLPLQNALLTASSLLFLYLCSLCTCYSGLPGSSQTESEAAPGSSPLAATPLQHLHQASKVKELHFSDAARSTSQSKAGTTGSFAERCPSLPIIRYEECRKRETVSTSLENKTSSTNIRVSL